MTWPKLKALVTAGYGQGHLQNYLPWLRVTKRDYSPNSVVGHLPSPEYGHQHAFRSLEHRKAILVLKWLGATDVRDRFPAWPWEHDHPGYGLPGVEAGPRLPGLIEIAAGMGVTHGTYPGSDAPYVATLQALSTWERGDGSYVFVAHQCTPEARLMNCDPLDRKKERLELLRRYCVSARIEHHTMHPETLPKEFVVNLDALDPRLPMGKSEVLRQSVLYRSVVERCSRFAYGRPANVVVDELRRKTRHSSKEILTALHAALWFQDLDHDLREPLSMWEPLIAGGVSYQRELRADWLKGQP